MGKHGRFDTDAQALSQRIRTHDKFGSRDINHWIFTQMDLASELSILDLGCGTGKQSLALAERLGASGKVVSVDASHEALDELRANAEARGLRERITPVLCTLDDLDATLPNGRFDRVLGAYSLYYVNDAGGLFRFIESRLDGGGILFFCGPGSENNLEIKRFHCSLERRDSEPGPTEAARFMEQTGQDLVRKIFRDVTVSCFENPLRFDSAESLSDYWSSYNLFDERLVDDFQRAAREWFETHSDFVTVKRVIGVRAVK